MAGPGLPSVDNLPRHKLRTVNFCNAFSVSVTLLQQYVVPFLDGAQKCCHFLYQIGTNDAFTATCFRDKTLTRLHRRSVVCFFTARERNVRGKVALAISFVEHAHASELVFDVFTLRKRMLTHKKKIV